MKKKTPDIPYCVQILPTKRGFKKIVKLKYNFTKKKYNLQITKNIIIIKNFRENNGSILTPIINAWGECTKYATFPLGAHCRHSWLSVDTGLYIKTMLLDNFPSYKTLRWFSLSWPPSVSKRNWFWKIKAKY